jgi:hypothetical protein
LFVELIAHTAAECRGYNRAAARVGMTGLGRPARVYCGGACPHHSKIFYTVTTPEMRQNARLTSLLEEAWYCQTNWFVLLSAMQTISLKLPETLLADLEKESRLRRTSKSALVRAALERELAPARGKKKPSCYDLARDLAGSLKGLPKDIATNPKYLEGFGE